MKVTSTEIKNNLGKYIRLAAKEDILITKNGKTVCRLTACQEDGNADSQGFLTRENASSYILDREKIKFEEFLEISRNSNERYEFIDGEIYLLASPTTAHQKILYELSVIFYNWFKGKKCTPMIAPYNIRLCRDEKNINIVQPDLMVICDLEENMDEDDHYRGVPALILEVVSQSSKSTDYIKKLDLYMSCGVMEYWIVDPTNREVHVFAFKNKSMDTSKTYHFDTPIKSFCFASLEADLSNFT